MVGYDLLNSSVVSLSVKRAKEGAVLTCSGKQTLCAAGALRILIFKFKNLNLIELILRIVIVHGLNGITLDNNIVSTNYLSIK